MSESRRMGQKQPAALPPALTDLGMNLASAPPLALHSLLWHAALARHMLA